MKKISCVLAALATVAVAAPTVASAQGQASPLLGRLKENGPLTGAIFLAVKQPPDLPLPRRAHNLRGYARQGGSRRSSGITGTRNFHVGYVDAGR
jgi:hypothetical protein